MDFSLSQEQQIFQDSARRMLETECRFETRGPLIAKGSFDGDRWRAIAEMGWLGMALPEEHGGFGGGAIETALLMEEIGRVLMVEPVWAIAVLTAHALLASGDERALALLPRLVAGEVLPVLAHNEADAGGVTEHVATVATPTAQGGWRISGEKTLVVGGNIADRFLVSARTSGRTGDREGISLFLVAADAAGLRRQNVRLIDNRWAAHLLLENVQVDKADVIGRVGGAIDALDEAHAYGLLAACAEAIGVMDRALWITRDYLKVRKQFGTTLSSFQALQHRMSEMLIELELSRSMLHRALSLFHAGPEIRRQALAAAKVHIGRSGKFVCGQAIQLHGGIGVTEEYVIGHYFKRMTTIEHELGHSHFHLQRLAELEQRRGTPVAPLAARNAA
ncbi:acyl-CoA dehydrogenase family protein [Fulvimonas soli]|jgi:alkylation response protein AidB-like acyl-CoA dehydrogenase|uniref:Alkylation response protein AidB-like acyl-CoA dehydrogenase n=1 Tax=Fulvimonas soli TaxID=155197 RepID=A0A316IGK3_9GAMM|nr:acyl-CoA dehydrogenase family protein [Fulvimonas soli]PWK91910.1 hypothetical protein C7456_10329 [Fulvimonas soli]TNY26037.1 acyl-CoA dehydrogenase [Fulvimonas soli]